MNLEHSTLTFLIEYQIELVIGVLIIFGLTEVAFGYLSNSMRDNNDVLIDSKSTFMLLFTTKPIIFFLSYEFSKILFPHNAGAWESLPVLASLLFFIFVGDFLLFWYHRSSHEYKWLWKDDRLHHSATEMGLLVSYRESVYFFLMMPNIWWLGIFTYFGGGISFALGLIIKQLIIISSHSLEKWDKILYSKSGLVPNIKILELILITLAFHHSHHSVSKIDDIGNTNGNFGNMFSLRDQLFSTANFTHAFPTYYGIPQHPKDSWEGHLFYPIITSKEKNSELSKVNKFLKTTNYEPALVILKEGHYLYSTYGYSRNQSFYDGSHQGTKFQPQEFTIKKREYKMCLRKLYFKGPICDDYHLNRNSMT